MSSIFVTSAFLDGVPGDHWNLGPFRTLMRAASHLPSEHSLAATPEAADWILFSDSGPEPFMRAIRRSRLFNDFRHKVFVVCHDDRPLALLPGVYASIERRWHDRSWARSGFFIHDRFPEFHYQEFTAETSLLYSFVGTVKNSSVRQALMKLDDRRGVVRDVSGEVVPAFMSGDMERVQSLVDGYRALVRRSRFVLCPRGQACSTVRLFEVMSMGRVPVIISDSWVEPEGPQWQTFSLRVAEDDIAAIPALLEQIEPSAEAMGLKARAEWEKWFAPDSSLRTIVSTIDCLRRDGDVGSPWRRLSKYAQFGRPYHARVALRPLKRAFERVAARVDRTTSA